MPFNSISFALFFLVVFFCYWFVANKNFKIQNVLLLMASYFFYACWDYRFLFLLIFSTLLDYFTGRKMEKANSNAKKKIWFILSVGINFGFLGLFKYYDFFITSFSQAVSSMGFKANLTTLNLLLPLGISFYTFHGLSYVIDIYKGRIKAEKNFIDYAVFVSFFPLLVAGPIERATHLLPQIQRKREFDYSKAVDGLKQILWGVFKKVVIADNCAEYANTIFNNPGSYSGSTHVIGAIFFAIQIYSDFSGYSDIALGTSRLLGIELLRNFSYPYFSRDIAEFWRRWHISLTTWFRDYLYIPLGGSRGSLLKKIRNTFIIFLVSGFWHGANWTFIIWGALNAIYFLPLLLTNQNRNNISMVAEGKYLPSLKEFFGMLFTFSLVVFAWIFFRSNNLTNAFSYVNEIFSKSIFTRPFGPPTKLIIIVIGFFLIEWLGRENPHPLMKMPLKWPRALSWAIYYSLLLLIFFYSGSKQQFIYFQF